MAFSGLVKGELLIKMTENKMIKITLDNVEKMCCVSKPLKRSRQPNGKI